MGKLLVALATLLLPAMVTQDPEPQPESETQPEIFLSPLPPTQGQQLTIEYTGIPGTVLDLDWDPAASPSTVTIGRSGKAVVRVPTGVTSLLVSDPTPNGAISQSTVIMRP
jgi:hypothetical protein